MRPNFAALIFVLVFCLTGISQTDPDPNSPEPVLLSHADSTRAMTEEESILSRNTRRRLEAFPPGAKVTLYASGLELSNEEGRNSVRIYAEDKQGRIFRFPVLNVSSAKSLKDTQAITVWLRDDIGYWDGPAQGDVLLRLTWRGMSSNRVRLGYGKSGGEIKDDTGAYPTPPGSQTTRRTKQEPTNEALYGYKWSGDRIRFLEQATFGATPALDQRLRRIGLRTYLAEQFSAPYPSPNNPYPDIELKSTDSSNVTIGCGMYPLGPERDNCWRYYYTMYPVQNWFMKEALYGDAQLRHKVAWALSQIWVISGAGGSTQQASWMIAYHKLLSQHAFGNYRDLMRDVTLNPGMGNYLDMARSRRQSPNENYAREILQLFTVGLFMLNQDGTLVLDSNGDPIPTYSQEDVENFTKVFTGWSFCNQTCPSSAPGIVNYKDPMILTQGNHDVTAKTLLDYPNAVNRNIEPNLDGSVELEKALDNIFYHPNVAPFVSKLLIQHLVTSDPTPAYVGRVSSVFNNNGSGVRGDLKSVIRAILLDPEARGDVKTDPFYGKLREPVQFMTNILKAFNVGSADLLQQSDGVLTNLTNPMGQNPFNSPTVFNYYSPDYVVPGTALLGPEFGLMTTGSSVARANAVNTMVYSRLTVSVPTRPLGTSINLADMDALATADPTGNLLLDELDHRLLHKTMSPQMRALILPAFTAVSASNPRARAQAAIYLVATSSQFQVQR
ncbi:MAG: DUF1800 domain-containing protein [Acidobacteria bacterium]|nr:DUF1800 domain-containing protein [Acidobacteriota bacterium]